MSKEIERISDEYFEMLGAPKPGHTFGLIDRYRFNAMYERLSFGSVLDVGAYFGDFLKLARKGGHTVFGTEVNAERVEGANFSLGEDVVRFDFRNGLLRSFDDKSIDNVVCMEVIEHVPDDKLAISELCRVAKKKVLISVPFQEKIRSTLCVHCNNYTPYHGHLHEYDYGTLHGLLPEDWKITEEFTLAGKITRIVIAKLPNHTPLFILKILDFIFRGSACWLMVVLEPKNASDC